MVKHGPCYHCGIEKTPLWRNGPPEKPVLCNACGSRWRIRGTLEDYVPKHALPFMTKPTRGKTQKSYQHKLPLEKIPMSHPNTMVRKESHSDSKGDVVSHDVVHNESHSNSKGDAVSHGDTYSTGFGENASHRTSSGSSSISCSDHTHSEPLSPGHCSNYWNSNIPSRKRSLVQYQNLTFVEKLQKDLYDILQNEEATSLSECSDGNLIYYENGGNHEIGLGALLLNPPITAAQQESKKFHSEGVYEVASQ